MLGALLLLSAQVRAQPAADPAAHAAELYREANELMDAGNHAAACPKLEQAYALVPGFGIQFNLAHCYEKTARLASAHQQFTAAATTAQAQNRQEDWARAIGRARALEARINHIELRVTAPPEGLEIRVDDAIVARWQEPLPVDAGAHHIVASAPSRPPFTKDVTLGGEGKTEVVTIDFASPSVAQPPPTPSEQPGTSGLAIAGWVATGTGAAAVIAGSVFGGLVLAKKADADEFCPEPDRCFQEGIDLNDEAHAYATASNVLIGVGAAAVAGGITMVLLAPSGEGETTALSVEPHGEGAQASLRLRW